MLSKAAAFRSKTKEEFEQNYDYPEVVGTLDDSDDCDDEIEDMDALMTDDDDSDEEGGDDAICVAEMDDDGGEEESDDDNGSQTAENDERLSMIWKRDPEREGDNALGVFVISGQTIPRDIFHSIMSFVPAYPFYFNLRSVCSQWLYEFQDKIFPKVTYLSLVDDGRPRYYFKDSGKLVQFKPLGAAGKGYRLRDLGDETKYYDRAHIFMFLATVFPNVRHLRLGVGSFMRLGDFHDCVRTLVSKLTQLETVDVLGTRYSYRKKSDQVSLNEISLYIIAQSLPISTKTLNFIGITLQGPLSMLQIFSEKGRSKTNMSPLNRVIRNNPRPIIADVQHLSLPYIILCDQPSIDWTRIKEMYFHFEVLVVKSSRNSSTPIQAPVASYVDYVNYMSKKQGIFLSHIPMEIDTDETMEATIDIAVTEYPYFQPLLSLPVTKKVVLLATRTKLDTTFVCNNVSTAVKALEVLTDPERMKYPELVLDINRTFKQVSYPLPCTLLTILIQNCSNETVFNLIKIIVERHKPSMTVHGVQNYLLELIMNHQFSPLRSNMMRYLLSINPELIALGNSEGVINNDQKDIPLIQLFLSRHSTAECLQDLKYLVEAGASITQVDKDGNNILHSACRMVNMDIVKYILSICPESFMFERNRKGQTPLELIFSPTWRLNNSDINVQVQFLQEAAKLPCFGKQTMSSYQTSRGNLLHVASESSDIETIQWLLENGFDANALNEKGENALFYSKVRIRRKKPTGKQSAFVDDCAAELIKAGAKVDLENNEGGTLVLSALRIKNYAMINMIIQKPSISSKPLAELLGPRVPQGLNALHFIVQKMIETTVACWSFTDMDKKIGVYPVARHCALLCLEHYPEMLYERSEPSTEEDMKDISGVSPLQMLLKASKGLLLLKDLSIKLSDIANKPVFSDSSKKSDDGAPIPLLYLALEVALDIPMFDKLMDCTNNVLVRDETQETKPNLLHIAAERDASLMKCILKHWKKKVTNKEDLSKLINQPLENDNVGGRKPRNAALLAWSQYSFERFSILWPFMKPCSSQFDCPVQIALAEKKYSYAFSAVQQFNIIPSKAQLHQMIRSTLVQGDVHQTNESKFVSLMTQTEEEQPAPSWLHLLMQNPSEAVDSKEQFEFKSLSTLQLVASGGASSIFNWLVRQYGDDPMLSTAVKAIDPRTGNTLLHLLTSGSQKQISGKDLSSILYPIVDQFRMKDAPKQTKQIKTKPPSLDYLNTKELTEFINIQNKGGRTCLHNVAVNDIQSVLHDLLVYGANTEIKDVYGQTPLKLMDDSATAVVQRFLEMRDGKKPEKQKRKLKQSSSNSEEVEETVPRRKRRRVTKK